VVDLTSQLEVANADLIRAKRDADEARAENENLKRQLATAADTVASQMLSQTIVAVPSAVSTKQDNNDKDELVVTDTDDYGVEVLILTPPAVEGAAVVATPKSSPTAALATELAATIMIAAASSLGQPADNEVKPKVSIPATSSPAAAVVAARDSDDSKSIQVDERLRVMKRNYIKKFDVLEKDTEVIIKENK
jgi:uncharacterized membrane protein